MTASLRPPAGAPAADGLSRARGAGKWLLFAVLDFLCVPEASLRLRSRRAVILLYHGVCPPRSEGGIFNYRKKFIAPEIFTRQLAWLKRRYTIMPLADLVLELGRQRELPRPALAITFDDGYENVYTHAFPILRALGVPATVFIATDLVEPAEPLWFDRLEYAIGRSPKASIAVPCAGRTQEFHLRTDEERCAADAAIREMIKRLPIDAGRELLKNVIAATGKDLAENFSHSPYRGLTWSHIRDMQRSGISFAPHTRSHTIIARLPPADQEEEIIGSRNALRERIGDVLNVFAYPNGQPGDFNASSAAILRNAGFIAACTTTPGFVRPGCDPYALPRMTLDGSDDMRLFRLTVTGVRAWLQSLRAGPHADAGEFFNKEASTYAAAYNAVTPEGFSFRERKRLALGMLGNANGWHVLDIGSGPGVIVGELLATGARVTAIDIAPAMIERLRERFRDQRLTAIVGDIETMAIPDGACDAAIVLGVFEYLDRDERAMGALKRVLKAGSIAIVSFPNRFAPWRLWNRFLLTVFRGPWRAFQAIAGKRPHPIRHREYTEQRIRTLAQEFGFEVVETSGYNFKIVLAPFDRLFPRITIAIARGLARLGRTRFKFLATGYIVKFRKRESALKAD